MFGHLLIYSRFSIPQDQGRWSVRAQINEDKHCIILSHQDWLLPPPPPAQRSGLDACVVINREKSDVSLLFPKSNPCAFQEVNDGRRWRKSVWGPYGEGSWGQVFPPQDLYPTQRPVRQRGAQRGGDCWTRDEGERSRSGGGICRRRGAVTLSIFGTGGVFLPETNHSAAELVSEIGLQPISFYLKTQPNQFIWKSYAHSPMRTPGKVGLTPYLVTWITVSYGMIKTTFSFSHTIKKVCLKVGLYTIWCFQLKPTPDQFDETVLRRMRVGSAEFGSRSLSALDVLASHLLTLRRVLLRLLIVMCFLTVLPPWLPFKNRHRTKHKHLANFMG